MTDGLDERLALLARAPTHPRLGSLEEAVLGRIGAQATASARGILGVAVVLALVVGIAGGLLPDDRARASGQVSLSAAEKLAPSTLLLGAR